MPADYPYAEPDGNVLSNHDQGSSNSIIPFLSSLQRDQQSNGTRFQMQRVNMDPIPDASGKHIHPSRSIHRKLSEQSDSGNSELDPYIIPTDSPPYYIESEFAADVNSLSTSPPNLPRNQSSLPNKQPSLPTKESDSLPMRGKRSQRFDSGVEDCESDHGSSAEHMNKSMSVSSQGSTSHPRLSTHYEQHYEDIDQYSRDCKHFQRNSTDKTELANLSQIHSGRNYIHQLPHINLTDVVSSDSEDTSEPVRTISIAETVSPPTEKHISFSKEMHSPHTYMPLGVQRHHLQKQHMKVPAPSRNRRCCPLVFMMLVMFAISAAALALSVYIIFSDSNNTSQRSGNVAAVVHPGTSKTEELFEQLKQEIGQLKSENAELKESLHTHQANVSSQLQPLERDVLLIQSSYESMRNELQLETNKLSIQIANMSLTPGPRGPVGIVNFSLCRFVTKVTTGKLVSAMSKVRTEYNPTQQVLQDSFVTFAFCSVEQAKSATLEYQQITGTDYYQYRCSCSGNINEEFTKCSLHFWLCPRNSPVG